MTASNQDYHRLLRTQASENPCLLWKSIVKGDLEKVNRIMESVPDVDAHLNKYGWTPLHAACFFGKIDIVQHLVTRLQADPNRQNSNGWHALIFALFGGHLDVIDYLLFETRADPSLTDANHRTALAIAEELWDEDAVALIKERTDSNSTRSSLNLSIDSLLKTLENY